MFFPGNEAGRQNDLMPIAASSPRLAGDQNRLQAQARGLTLGDLVMEVSIHGGYPWNQVVMDDYDLALKYIETY